MRQWNNASYFGIFSYIESGMSLLCAIFYSLHCSSKLFTYHALIFCVLGVRCAPPPLHIYEKKTHLKKITCQFQWVSHNILWRLHLF